MTSTTGRSVAAAAAASSGTWRGLARIVVGASAGGRWGRGEFAAGKDDGDVDDGAVELGFVHVGDGGFGIGFVDVQDVGCAAVCAGCCSQRLAMTQKLMTIEVGVTYMSCSKADPSPQSLQTGQRFREGGSR